MKQLSYQIKFLTPAFLGDAEQQGRWRTPPFKALLRQWWRVVYAAEHNFQVDHQTMLRDEGELFGCASDKFTSKSQILLRLEPALDTTSLAWTPGTHDGVKPLSTGLDTGYAWFGLIDSKTKKALRTGIATNPEEGTRRLKLALPEKESERIAIVMRLIAGFGQMGARSRGGWGSIHIPGIEPLTDADLTRYARSLNDCLGTDWPMSLAIDDKGICLWYGARRYNSWDKAMQAIALERSTARKSLKSILGRDLRSVLGFAKGKTRMASPLRWRVSRNPDDSLGLIVFAMPSCIPRDGQQQISPKDTAAAWYQVVNTLDQSARFNARSTAN